MDIALIQKTLTDYAAAMKVELAARAKVTAAETALTSAKIALNNANADLAKAVTTTAAARTKMDDTIKAEVEKVAKA